MTNSRTRDTRTSPLPKSSAQISAASKAAQTADVCDLLLAELQSRRARLQKLLELVQLEAVRLSGTAPDAVPTHRHRTHCIAPRLKRPA